MSATEAAICVGVEMQLSIRGVKQDGDSDEDARMTMVLVSTNTELSGGVSATAIGRASTEIPPLNASRASACLQVIITNQRESFSPRGGDEKKKNKKKPA